MKKWSEALEFRTLSVQDISYIIKDMRSSEHEFFHKQADKLEHYLNQYGNEVIGIKELNTYLYDIHDLTDMEILKDEIKDKVLLQRAYQLISELMMKGALSLAKTIL
jgi:hypothetical protein